jgi:hypothetical protein
VRHRCALLVAAGTLLLAACGDDEPPTRSKDIEPGTTCRTEGTIEAQPASSIQAAVEPFREPGDKLRIAERFGDTAEVQLGGAVAVTLVRTGQGWVVTSVVRC